MCAVGDEAEGIILLGFPRTRGRIHFPVRLSVGSATGLLRGKGGEHQMGIGRCGSVVSGIR